jgi:hypothetical protein
MLRNRLDELEELSRALSICLDNLAEEVSVCCGLLLAGSGGSALATHVRSLKAASRRRHQQLERCRRAHENSQDELAYWIRECGGGDCQDDILSLEQKTTPVKTDKDEKTNNDDSQKEQERQQLKAQIAASENKIRMLRASIADLSEENVRNLEAVEQRGLSGGIHLVRGLRDEIRELEFQLNAVQSADASCRTKMSLIQSKLNKQKQAAAKKQPNGQSPPLPSTNGDAKSDQHAASISSTATNGDSEHGVENGSDVVVSDAEKEELHNEDAVDKMTESERIANGQSTAIVVRQENGGVPFSLWQLLMRMIGLSGSDNRHNQSSSSSSLRSSSSSDSRPVMIL